jgi:hypothetical protein
VETEKDRHRLHSIRATFEAPCRMQQVCCLVETDRTQRGVVPLGTRTTLGLNEKDGGSQRLRVLSKREAASRTGSARDEPSLVMGTNCHHPGRRRVHGRSSSRRGRQRFPFLLVGSNICAATPSFLDRCQDHLLGRASSCFMAARSWYIDRHGLDDGEEIRKCCLR